MYCALVSASAYILYPMPSLLSIDDMNSYVHKREIIGSRSCPQKAKYDVYVVACATRIYMPTDIWAKRLTTAWALSWSTFQTTYAPLRPGEPRGAHIC